MTREDAIWWVNHLFEIRKEEYFNKGMMKDAKEVDEAQHIVIYALQTDVVRCKDCKHYSIEGETTHFGWCGYWNKPTDGIRYCSDGERREE